jgi:glutamate/tyrosine decarboxylase-like PLP-dependent enzyme
VLHHLGEEGYLRLTAAARAAFDALVAGLRATPGIRILGDPEVTLVAFTFDDADAFAVGNALWDRGWFCDQQGPPPSLHCMVNAVHGPYVDGFLDALRDALGEVRLAAGSGEQVPYASME